MKETPNSKNTVKLLMNYCPLSEDNTPHQLSWGHEKEVVAIKEYIKKHKTKLKGIEVFQRGLIKDKQYPHLGASWAFLAREFFNPMLQQLTALMKWLENTMSKKKRLGTIKGKDS